MIRDIQDAVQKYQSALENLNTKFSRDAIQGLVSDFVKDSSVFKGITWNQYTPYFNDGDSCEFSVSEIQPIMVRTSDEDDDESYYDHEEYYYDYQNRDSKDPIEIAKFQELKRIFSSIPDNVYYNVFGDHKTVTVTADSVESENYNHD